jgi:hypothetical protein
LLLILSNKLILNQETRFTILCHKIKRAGKSTWAKVYEDTIELDIIHRDAGKAKKGVTIAVVNNTEELLAKAELTEEDLEAVTAVQAQELPTSLQAQQEEQVLQQRFQQPLE